MSTATLDRPTRSFAKPRGMRKVKDSTATIFIGLSFLVALVPLIWLLWTVVSKGLSDVLHASWWTGTQRNIRNVDPGGGVLHDIVGTLEIVALTTVISVPIAVLVGVYLVLQLVCAVV